MQIFKCICKAFEISLLLKNFLNLFQFLPLLVMRYDFSFLFLMNHAILYFSSYSLTNVSIACFTHFINHFYQITNTICIY